MNLRIGITTFDNLFHGIYYSAEQKFSVLISFKSEQNDFRPNSAESIRIRPDSAESIRISVRAYFSSELHIRMQLYANFTSKSIIRISSEWNFMPTTHQNFIRTEFYAHLTSGDGSNSNLIRKLIRVNFDRDPVSIDNPNFNSDQS